MPCTLPNTHKKFCGIVRPRTRKTMAMMPKNLPIKAQNCFIMKLPLSLNKKIIILESSGNALSFVCNVHYYNKDRRGNKELAVKNCKKF